MNKKQAAGEKALEWVENGMTIGLGTGSTVYYTILKLGDMVKNGFRILAVPTSKATEQLAHQLNIPLTSLSGVDELQLTIDGADAISPDLDLIKGGGGALLREKLVAKASKKLIIIADDAKNVPSFNGVSIPIEVVPFAWETTSRRIELLGGIPCIRKIDGDTVVTDNHNFILDTIFQKISSATALDHQLKLLTGVVETGLFTGMADIVIVAGENGTKIRKRATATGA